MVRSSSLVPANDPTLLFTNAGMNQFKEVFLGLREARLTRERPPRRNASAREASITISKMSGYTRRHHTFFEMLGNFSFGDYFKKDAIAFAWELVTSPNWYGMPKDKLYVTIFREDDEAEELWQKVAGVAKDRIFRLDEKDNFWQMGETGPCGPCSEIHYDLGPQACRKGPRARTVSISTRADATSKSGISSSCSSTALKMERSPRCLGRRSIPGWASSVSRRCCRDTFELRHRSVAAHHRSRSRIAIREISCR